MVYIQRYLTQLGSGEPVQQAGAGLPAIHLAPGATKMSLRFGRKPEGGLTVHSAAAVLAHLVTTDGVYDIIVREDSSVIFYLDNHLVPDLLRLGGQNSLFVKALEGDFSHDVLLLLLLGPLYSLEQALETQQEFPVQCLGVIQKTKASEDPEYGLRFANEADLRTVADALDPSQELGNTALAARFKIDIPIPSVTSLGVAGVMEAFHQPGQQGHWPIDGVLYLGEGHAIVTSREAPPTLVFSLWWQGTSLRVHIRAKNERARALCRGVNMAIASTGPGSQPRRARGSHQLIGAPRTSRQAYQDHLFAFMRGDADDRGSNTSMADSQASGQAWLRRRRAPEQPDDRIPSGLPSAGRPAAAGGAPSAPPLRESTEFGPPVRREPAVAGGAQGYASAPGPQPPIPNIPGPPHLSGRGPLGTEAATPRVRGPGSLPVTPQVSSASYPIGHSGRAGEARSRSPTARARGEGPDDTSLGGLAIQEPDGEGTPSPPPSPSAPPSQPLS